MKHILAVMVFVPGMVATSLAAQNRATNQRFDTVATVEVENNRKVPVTVYLEYGVFDRRIGEVPAMQTATLPIPRWAPNQASVQLFVHPEGERDLETQNLSVTPGEQLALIVPASGKMLVAPSDTMYQTLTPEELSETTLTVDNPRPQSVTVFVEQGAFDVRLGQVAAHSRETLPVPKSVFNMVSAIEIFVHPEGGRDLSGEVVDLGRGAHLGLRVPTYP
jgi:hypothetical protein